MAAQTPFFLYFNPTVPHSPQSKDILSDGLCSDGTTACSSHDTPMGRLVTAPAADLLTLCDSSASAACVLRSRAAVWAATQGLATGGARSDIAATAWIDDGLGALLAVLEQRSALANTLVIVTSDNGWAKGTAYEMGARVPLFMRYPSEIVAGTLFNSSILASLIVSVLHVCTSFLKFCVIN